MELAWTARRYKVCPTKYLASQNIGQGFVCPKRLEALNSGMAKRESPSPPGEGTTPAVKKRWFF
ncbi:hypothetical protein TRIUR3_12894 [Triticum urartu]|uniref:Uncharacterized protein n=1 Tax=Triticum urartu TaxID=4572 RepID=M7YU74_TRIUA|nr:hypothetical protein TRIUR3_12894 [Triticum urartu]